jgi:hypothetical protein
MVMVPLQKESGSFLKKEPKNFCYSGPEALAAPRPRPGLTKVFLLLFLQKKKCFFLNSKPPG